MKKKSILLLSYLLIQQIFAVNASQELLLLSQPTGETFHAYNNGDEWAGWHTTELGFPIVKNDEGWWVYANRAEGNRLIGSSRRVYQNDDDRYLENLGFSKNVKPKRNYVIEPTEIPNLMIARTDTFKVPLLLVDFPNYSNQYDEVIFEDIMNSIDNYGHPGHPGSGSFRDFYHEVSYGQFDPISTIDGWYTAPENHNYYAYSNPDGYDHVLTLVRAIVDSAEAHGMDWSQFDNDGDGTVDALNLIHAGPGAEQGDHSNIWSHKWALSAAGLQVQYDGVWINSYTMNPEIQSNNIVAIGVICHEFGHALGLPDLYDTDYSSSGAGKLALMASGSWGTAGTTPWYPSAMNAWCKTELGWSDVITLSGDQTSIDVEQSFSSNVVYRIDHTIDDSEYWLVENRQKVGTDVNMPSGGLLFWHIDTEKTQGWGVNNDEPHYGVGLEQADGLYNLENNSGSDGSDPFPGNTDNRNFSYNTTPSTDSYYFEPSMITFDNISDPDSLMNFDLVFNEYLIASMDVENSTGPAYDIGYFDISLSNDVTIASMTFQLHFSPNIFDIVNVEAIGRMVVDSVTVSDQTFTLHNPTVSAGNGSILRVHIFTNSGSNGSANIGFNWVVAEDTSGNGIGFQLGNGIYSYAAQAQILSFTSDSGAVGGYGKFGVKLENTVPIKMFLLEIVDGPNFLTPFEELYTDSNGNSMWDAGEPFEDMNNDGVWTPMIELTSRMSGWQIQSSYTASGIQIAGNNPIPIAIGDSTIFYVNNVIDGDAAVGPVTLTLTPTIIIDEYGNNDLTIDISPGSFIITPALSVDGKDQMADQYSVSPNYPNPFNPSTTLDYTLPEDAEVTIKIYDTMGRMVFDYSGTQNAGRYTFKWDGINKNGQTVSSGVYFLTFNAGNFVSHRKLILMK